MYFYFKYDYTLHLFTLVIIAVFEAVHECVLVRPQINGHNKSINLTPLAGHTYTYFLTVM